MSTQRSEFKRVAIFLISISAASIPAMAHADWSLKALDTLSQPNFIGGVYFDHATAINDAGQVTGFFNTSIGDHYDSSKNHAFITGPNGMGMTDLGTLGGDDSQATAINNSGQVVGISLTASNNSYQAFIAGSDSVGMTHLSSWLPALSSMGINDSGQIAGSLWAPVGNIHAFVTGPDGAGVTDLGTLGERDSNAYSINNSGQVVGDSSNTSGATHAFITGPNGKGMTDLGTLGGGFSSAVGINDFGQTVGVSNTAALPRFQHAFIMGPDGVGMTDLGTLGGKISIANAINDSGEVVGEATTADGDFHSFLYSHGGITDLSMLDVVVATGYSSFVATDINNNGQIIGNALKSDGESEMFLLSYTPDTVFTPNPIFVPIPEPQTYAMLLAGLGLVGFMARRRKETVV